MSCRISSSDSGERSVTISTRSPSCERPREVAQLAVDLHGQRGAREAGADGGGEVGARGAVVEVLAGAVRQLDLHSRRDASRAKPRCGLREHDRSAPRNGCRGTRRAGSSPSRRATAIDGGVVDCDRATTLARAERAERLGLERPRALGRVAAALEGRGRATSRSRGRRRAMPSRPSPAKLSAIRPTTSLRSRVGRSAPAEPVRAPVHERPGVALLRPRGRPRLPRPDVAHHLGQRREPHDQPGVLRRPGLQAQPLGLQHLHGASG